jgi:hypothetical protein
LSKKADAKKGDETKASIRKSRALASSIVGLFYL